MFEFNIFSYDNIESDKKGNFSLGWVKFNTEPFKGKEVLLKNIPGEDPSKSSLIYPNKENFEIPYIALNSLVSELICNTGDDKAKAAEYYLAKQDGKLLICSPSFRKEDEELIEGNDRMKIGHRGLKRANPYDVLTIANDITEELTRKNIPKNEIRDIIVQYVRDSFKNAYLGIYDSNNDNFGVLLSRSGHARIAPIYDLDLGLNVPFEYKDDVDPEFKKSHEEYVKTLYAPNYLSKYISTMQQKFYWFEDWAEEFMQNLKHIDLKKQLSEEKGLDIPDEQVKHYTDFIDDRNGQLQKYLYETRFENQFEI